MNARLDGELRERKVEVVRDGAHDGVALTHEREYCFASANVESCRKEARPGIRRQESRNVFDVQVGEPNLANVGILK